jgi:hypothetical protein
LPWFLHVSPSSTRSFLAAHLGILELPKEHRDSSGLVWCRAARWRNHGDPSVLCPYGRWSTTPSCTSSAAWQRTRQHRTTKSCCSVSSPENGRQRNVRLPQKTRRIDSLTRKWWQELTPSGEERPLGRMWHRAGILNDEKTNKPKAMIIYGGINCYQV